MENTINTYQLTIDDNKGLKSYYITPFNAAAYSFSRECIKNIKTDDLVSIKGIYILVNRSTKEIYFGETGNIIERLCEHNRDESKKYFNEVYLILSEDFTKNTQLFFENRLINDEMYLNMSNWISRNRNSGNKIEEESRVNGSLVHKDFEIVINKFLRIFDPINNDEQNVIEYSEKVFEFNNRKGFYGQMIIDNKGEFILKKGAIINRNPSERSLSDTYIKKILDIINNPELVKIIDDERGETIVDIKQPKPTFLCDLVSGLSLNGWTNWKNNGKTLDELVERKKYK